MYRVRLWQGGALADLSQSSDDMFVAEDYSLLSKRSANLKVKWVAGEHGTADAGVWQVVCGQ
jgi:hypothetical protein